MPSSQPYNERKLLSCIAEGDEQAFGVLLQEYWRTIYSHAIAYLKSVEKAEETTQDIFMQIWNTRQTLPAVKSLKDYMFIVARNKIYNEARKKIAALYLPLENPETDNAFPDQQIEYKETYQILLRGIELLPEQRRKVFKMSRLEGMSNEEIAQALGMRKETVYQYVVKAQGFLRVYMKEHGQNSFILLILLNSLY